MPRPLGTTIDNDTVEQGTVVSLNLNRRQYLGVPGFTLSAASPTGRVPQGLDANHLSMLRGALEKGFLVLGSRPVQSDKDQTEMVDLYASLDACSGPEDLKDLLGPIVIRKRRVGSMAPYQVLRELTEHETLHECRDDVINYLARLMERIPGPRPVTEHPRDEQTVQLLADGTALVPGREVSSMKRILDGGAAGGYEQKTPDQSEAINDLF